MPSYTGSVIGMRIWQAAQVVQAANAWVGIGKNSSWGDTDTPPQVDPSTTALDGLIALKKAETLTLVVPDPNGTIEHLGQKWMPVTVADARTKQARWVYAAAWLRYDEVPVVTYRQTGAFLGVTRNANVDAGKLVLLPTEVSDLGFLAAVNNRSPIPRAEDQKELVEFIIEF
ncbi:hypothetical protein DEAC_c14340 [Desulfosporosinus acididurans]|uniref:Uncharacterized protein n=1 Tax=Desulfosporosinus acididurans TaxID=476652 RepID=A0A0J1IPZ8_9FIRM|nr:hypothetical protein [Desulfosporosinus acididurans]KLU66766.1 hypothetical protein DEAC_c14340 [Desulfosporosinus acididurans]